MAYIKNTWVDQQVERPRTYQFNSNPDGSTTLIDDFGQVTEIGTPVNADNMNHIENGIANSATVDLDNLSAKGKLKVLDGKITNCILEAPNGVMTYSGADITAKQGLKVLMPNGDTNVEYTLQQDVTSSTSAFTKASFIYLFIRKEAGDYQIVGRETSRFLYGSLAERPKTLPNVYTHSYYAIDERKFYTSVGSTTANWQPEIMAYIGKAQTDGKVITEIYPCSPIELLKRTDKDIISGWGMPSHKSISLTLGKSGSTYIAPANGYYYLNKTAGADWHYIEITGDTNASQYPLHGSWKSDYRTAPLKILYPVLKGDVIKVNYNATGKTNWFRFIYAEGEV